MITAKVIADSTANSIRLTTLELEYPRFIHSEFMTHRMFSRNASSSRAIPAEKMLTSILDNCAVPINWGKNKRGMQANITLDEWGKATCKNIWRNASLEAVKSAKHLAEQGLHKQIVNRVLEPFSHIKVIVTATEWDNFFELRLHKDAQPEIQELAGRMKEAMDASTPKDLKHGEWHLPYYYGSYTNEKGDPELDVAIKCSVSRCARVSYLNHDNSNPNVDKDIKLADDLLAAGHMSPFEHQATPMEYLHYRETEQRWPKGVTHTDRMSRMWSGNLMGWVQYRQLIE